MILLRLKLVQDTLLIEDFMKLFFKYIHKLKKGVTLFFLFSLIFLGIFALYDIYIEAVIYAFLICTFIGLIVVCIGFINFQKRHIMLKNIYKNLPLMTENLPNSENLIQEDLQRIIDRLSEINQNSVNNIRDLQKDITDYFTVWVHQIKTPIAAMQMILQSEDTETSLELNAELFKIEQYAEMALNYIRLDSNSNDLVIKRYNLDNIIKQAIQKYAPLFIRRRIKLIYSSINAEILTDEKWLLFIIEQLLSNAVKYTINGSVSITYKNEILTISDTGIGIADEDIPRIFEKGYTGLSGRTDKKSTGLGLYLCKIAADKLNHGIYVKSEIGKGSAFSIDLSVKSIDIE